MRPNLAPALRCLAFFAVAVALFAPSAGAAGLTADDLVEMRRISDPQPSADGDWVAFVVRSTDRAADRGRTDLWRVPADGSAPAERLTSHEAGDWSPRWSPDGRSLFFLSSRSGASQVWRLPMAGGEAVQVTDLPLDVGGFAVSPDGTRLAVALEVFVDCGDLQCTVDRLDASSERTGRTGLVYDRLFVRHWDTWKDGRRSHLFVVPVSGDGKAVDVMAGLDADTPSKPFGGMEEVAWTPDGRELVFAARLAGVNEPWSTNFDLWVTPADGSAAPRRLTENPAWDTHPVFSPDGSTLAYTAHERAGYESDRFGIVLRAWPDGAPRKVATEWDRSVASMLWAPDGQTLYVTAQNVGHHSLFAIDVASGSVRELVGEGHVRSPAVAGDRMVYGLDTLQAPVDLYSQPLAALGGDRQPTQLTEINADRLADIEMGEAEQFSFAGWNGETVYGWMVKPVGFEEGGRYPIAFLIHGGPQGSFDNDFHYRWNPQVYAAAGFAAVMIDFHGSTGYGQAFTDSIRGDWGGKPLEDLQKGLAAAKARYSFLDGERSCALGASYGGYMINWIAGHWNDAFDCLVNHDGLFDMRSMYYTTEELWFIEWEMGGPEWQNRETYTRWSPSQAVENWQMPMLVIHGALDYRVPPSEGLATFTALQRQGIPSQLLFFPDENHWVLKPSNSVQWHEVVLDWLERWTAEDP